MTSSDGIKLLTLDLDDTLWPCLRTIRRAEDALYAWLAACAPRLTAVHDQSSLREHRLALMRTNAAIAHDLTAVRQASLAALLARFGYRAALAEEAMAVFLDHRNRVEPYSDVAPVLRALGEGYRLVSVTNGNSDVTRTPLNGLFHHSLTAADVGAQKPDPALFAAAVAWAELDPAEALHAGDDPHRDVQAARDFGMAAVWVNRAGDPWPENLEPPIAEVADMQGLKVWLEGTDCGV
jgi:putative hydrolase of the HAD superfamily